MSTSSQTRGLTILLPAAAGLRLEYIDTRDQPIHFRLVATAPTARCSICAVVASRIHSRYIHTLADLPWAGVAVRLTLQVRTFFCSVVACP